MSRSSSRESSPDPLTQSWNSDLAIRPRSTPRRPILAITGAIYRALSRDTTQAPPSTLRHEHTPRQMRSADEMGDISPWRIMATVLSEQDEVSSSTANGLVPNTTTTKVPLKWSEEHTPARRRSKRVRQSTGQADEPDGAAVDASSKKRRISARDLDQASAKSLRNRVPTPRKLVASSVVSTNPGSASKESSHPDHGNQQDDETFSTNNGIEDDTTMLDQSLAESEGFSMVSIDSLRSHREQAEKEATTAQDTNTTDLSTNPPSKRQSLPPTASSSSKKKNTRKSQPKSNNSPFMAFGTDTRRQLSVELALGQTLAQEESFLAKKYPDWQNGKLPSPPETASLSSSRGSQESLPQKEPGNVSVETEPSRNEGSLPQRGDDHMSWRRTTPPPHVEHNSQAYEDQSDIHRTALAAANDIVYNAPRDKSDQPKESDTQQVDIAEDFTGTADIWQEEADRSMEDSPNSQRTRSRNLAREAETQETPDFNDLFEEDHRPSRARIPRTWRRTSGQGFLYSDEAESPARNLGARSESSAIKKSVSSSSKKSVKSPSKKSISSPTKNSISSPSKKANRSPSKRSLPSKPSQVLAKPAPKSILSSPARREQQNYTPKEVRFQNAARTDSSSSTSVAGNNRTSDNHFVDSIAVLEEDESFWQSLSSPLANRSTPGTEDSAVFSAQRNRAGSDLKNGYLQQLKAELIAMATPRGRELLHAPNDPESFETPEKQEPPKDLDENPSLEGDEEEEEELVDDESDDESRYVQTRPKEDPNFDSHVRHAKSIVITPLKASQSQGILSRLSTWLYPTPPPENTYTYTWNRNHYLLLNHLWSKVFPQPDNITAKEYSVSAQHRMLTTLPSALKRLVGARVTRYEGQTPLHVLLVHCYVAGQFISEARDKGVPILCDGRSKPSRDGDFSIVPSGKGGNVRSETDFENAEERQWPKRDAAGRIIRVKQDWTAEETLKAVYSLWLIKMSHARSSRRTLKRKQKGKLSEKVSC